MAATLFIEYCIDVNGGSKASTSNPNQNLEDTIQDSITIMDDEFL
jgi:hypothetical protein